LAASTDRIAHSRRVRVSDLVAATRNGFRPHDTCLFQGAALTKRNGLHLRPALIDVRQQQTTG